MKKGVVILFGCLGVIALAIGGALIWGIGVYNGLVGLDEAVNSQWAQVENAYQRRFDLIPNLVKTVQGAADFEKSTLENVVAARARVGQVVMSPGTNPTSDPAAFQQFQAAQDGLGSALSRLLVVVERYPELKANQNFLELQSQLEGTENRIAVERRRYNEKAQEFNQTVRRFPANTIAGMLGFQPKQYFKAAAGAESAPNVEFDFGNK